MKIKIDMPFCDRVDRISKANSVQFEELSVFDNKIIDSFRSVEDLNKFRLNLYNLYKTKVKIDFITVSEEINWDVIEKKWFKMSSDILNLSDNDVWRCLPYYVVKQFFRRSQFQHKYINRERVLFFDYL